MDVQTIISDSEADGYGSHSDCFHGQIDIILHPIYLVPCPYIQLCSRNGQSMSAADLRNLINAHRYSTIAHSHLGNDFNNFAYGVDEEVDLTIEEHPYCQAICLCPHVCGLGHRLALLAKCELPPQGYYAGNGVSQGHDKQLIPTASDTQVNSNKDHLEFPDFYLLNWFILVGPKIGIRHSPSFYSKIEQVIKCLQ